MTEQERAAASAEHYKRMRAELDRRLSLDPELRQLSKKIQNGSADFQDTFRYSEIVSNHIGRIMQENVGTITNPLGKQYVCEALLKDHYKAINDVLGEVQVQIDEKLDIHLNPVKPPCPIERIVQVAHALEDPTVPQKVIERRAKAPVVNVSMSFHDDYIKENAKIRAKLGLKPTITRYGSGCCKWCAEVAGRYRFGDQPKDVFRRHDNCKCTIIYDTQVLRGHQNEDGGRSKKWEEVDPKEVQAQGFVPTVNTPEQAKKMQENALNRLTLAGERDILRVADASAATGVKPAASSKEELERKTKQYNKMLDDYASRESKWSGDVFRVSFAFMKDATGQKEWSCSISIREDAGDKTIIHELLHARSCSYFTRDEFRRYRNLEECSVELFAQEICKDRRLPYTESYPLFISYLKDINRIAGIRQRDFDFARELYNTDMSKRLSWLKSEVQKSLNAAHISETDNSILDFYLEELEKGVLA